MSYVTLRYEAGTEYTSIDRITKRQDESTASQNAFNMKVQECLLVDGRVRNTGVDRSRPSGLPITEAKLRALSALY